MGSNPSLGRAPEGGYGNHSSILAGIIPWTEEAGGLRSMESQRVRHNWLSTTRIEELQTGCEEKFWFRSESIFSCSSEVINSISKINDEAKLSTPAITQKLRRGGVTIWNNGERQSKDIYWWRPTIRTFNTPFLFYLVSTSSQRRQWHPTPALLPGKSHEWRSLEGCSPWGRWELDTTDNFTFTFHFHALEKEMATHSSVLAWRIPGTGEPGGLPSMGSHRVRHDWSDLAAAASTLSNISTQQSLPQNWRTEKSVNCFLNLSFLST